MVGWDVERVEVERVSLDLRAVEHDEAELAEDAGDLARRLGERMQRTAPERAAGQRHVLGFRGQAGLERLCLEADATLGECFLDGAAHGVGERADLGSVLCGQLSDTAEQVLQRSLAAQQGRLDGVERLR